MIHVKGNRLFWPALYLMTILVLGPKTALAEEQALEEMVVTGSFIKGTPEDAALPVDVLTRTDLEDVGNPSLIEMVRNLGVTSGNIGETNQFDTRGSQAAEGTTAINLRGLGPARTLVLINSKRHVATETIGVDISAIPSIAIGRVEVLKDGAAALYGSDAIGGVVNFITRDSFEGFEVSGNFTDLDDSDGDTNVAAIFGRRVGALHFAISGEYEERSELRIRDRDWALRPFAENPGPGGWSSIGNPGTFFPGISNGAGGRTLLGGATPDPGCELLGGTSSGGFCRFQYTFFDNLVEEQESYKVFAEVNYDISDKISFHAEALYHDMDMPEWKTSPSYPPQALLGNDRFIEASHPGLIDLKAQNPGLFNEVAGIPASVQGASSWSRMLGIAGRNGQPESSYRKTKTKRISFGLVGETDSGIAFGATIRADNAGAGNLGTGGSQFVSGVFGKFSMGDLNGADESAAGGGVSGVGLTGLGDHNDLAYQSSAHNLGYEYTTAGVTFGYSQNTAVKTGSNSAMGVKWSGDMGGTTLGIGLGQSKVATATQTSVSLSMSTGGLTLKAISSSNDNGTIAAVDEVRHVSTAGSEKAYAVAIDAANNADTDQTGVSISYAMDAMSVTAFTKTVSTAGVKDKDYSGFGFTYDMGGVSLKAGVVDNNDQQLVDFGLSFSF